MTRNKTTTTAGARTHEDDEPIKREPFKILTYRAADDKEYRIQLYNPSWRLMRGGEVLRGQQRINGKLINRSFAKNEVIRLS